MEGREVYPDSLSAVKTRREALTEQLKSISFFSQPLKIKDFRRFPFLQVLKMYARTPQKGVFFETCF
jgi:hypothetical protein